MGPGASKPTTPLRWVGHSLLAYIVMFAAFALAADGLSDRQIRERMIEESISSYPGNCPCPYNLDRAGRRCGARSAYSRAGGYSPLCFASDISDGRVNEYRARHKIPTS
jgi:hypothetical protein